MRKILFLILCAICANASANSLQELDLYKSTAVYRVSGKIAVAASSTTYSTYTITLDGTAGISTTKPIVTTSSISAGSYSGNFANSADTTSFAGHLDIGGVIVSTYIASKTSWSIACPTGTVVMAGGCKTNSTLTTNVGCSVSISTGTSCTDTLTWPWLSWNCAGSSGNFSVWAACVRFK